MVPAVTITVACVLIALLVPSMGTAVLLMGLVLSALVAHRVWSTRGVLEEPSR